MADVTLYNKLVHFPLIKTFPFNLYLSPKNSIIFIMNEITAMTASKYNPISHMNSESLSLSLLIEETQQFTIISIFLFFIVSRGHEPK
jgi:hypothetical protein